jgi:hypothetical protein
MCAHNAIQVTVTRHYGQLLPVWRVIRSKRSERSKVPKEGSSSLSSLSSYLITNESMMWSKISSDAEYKSSVVP